MADFQRPPTAQEAVLVELRGRILRGDLAPGSPLRQEDLAASLGVSRVPVREALRMLESEGHVTYTPHRGYRVPELDLDELDEIYHLRALIEDDLAALVALGMMGIEEAGVEIEDPFGLEPNDLPLEQLCTTIARDTAQLTKE